MNESVIVGSREVPQSPAGNVTIYVDGSCPNQYLCGIGIFCQDYAVLQQGIRISGVGNNNTKAEFLAVLQALRLVKLHRKDTKQILIRTDCLACLRALKNKTRNASLREVIDEIKRFAESCRRGVMFEHVYSHSGYPGQEKADQLAYRAASNITKRRSILAPENLRTREGIDWAKARANRHKLSSGEKKKRKERGNKRGCGMTVIINYKPANPVLQFNRSGEIPFPKLETISEKVEETQDEEFLKDAELLEENVKQFLEANKKILNSTITISDNEEEHDSVTFLHKSSQPPWSTENLLM